LSHWEEVFEKQRVDLTLFRYAFNANAPMQATNNTSSSNQFDGADKMMTTITKSTSSQPASDVETTSTIEDSSDPAQLEVSKQVQPQENAKITPVQNTDSQPKSPFCCVPSHGSQKPPHKRRTFEPSPKKFEQSGWPFYNFLSLKDEDLYLSVGMSIHSIQVNLFLLMLNILRTGNCRRKSAEYLPRSF
jgi:hypothetical protein